jgi:malate dehydrogenase (oxaloacetate-decarboxylating)(NADP+)
MTCVQNDRGTFFFIDTHVQPEPTAEQLAEATMQGAKWLKMWGIKPKIALLSHSNFGGHATPSSLKMRQVLELVRSADPALEIDGEMQADTALNEAVRARIFPASTLTGQANLFVCPNMDAANIAYNLVRQLTEGVAIGPILMGISKPAHILTPAATVRRVVNMTALTCAEAQIRAQMSAAAS